MAKKVNLHGNFSITRLAIGRMMLLKLYLRERPLKQINRNKSHFGDVIVNSAQNSPH